MFTDQCHLDQTTWMGNIYRNYVVGEGVMRLVLSLSLNVSFYARLNLFLPGLKTTSLRILPCSIRHLRNRRGEEGTKTQYEGRPKERPIKTSLPLREDVFVDVHVSTLPGFTRL